ncbi:hypothetical protein AKJ16_DCAP02638 [Drosera capensis]
MADMNSSFTILRSTIEAIHSSPTQAVIYLAGGASHALGWLTSVPGASNTVLEAVVPYSRMSMIQLIGKVPNQFVSPRTAQNLAIAAYNRALRLSRPGVPVVGVAFTGSLATTMPKLGDHRFHLSTRTSDQLWISDVTLSKGLRTREEEEVVSSQHLLKAIATACKVPVLLPLGSSETDLSVESEELYDEDEELAQLLAGQIDFKILQVIKEEEYDFAGKHYQNEERKIVLPGSFNPLHNGHLKLLEVASGMCGGGYPCFEISAVNADKPPLTIPQIKERVQQFEKDGKTVIISNQPFFYKKAELFPGSAFVIGADTASRLVNPKYYDGNYNRMIELLLGCKKTGCTFLVGGRNVDGVFEVLDDIEIPNALKGMFIQIPAKRFRVDISSTQIRRSLNM